MSKRKEIVTQIITQNELPSVIQLREPSSGVTLRFYLDAIDTMSVGEIPNLQHLDHKQRMALLQSLNDVIKQTVGGNYLFSVASTEVEPIKALNLLGTAPLFSEASSFFRNLMVRKKDTSLPQVFAKYRQQFSNLQGIYQFLSDKPTLLNRLEETSDLLIEHASWAGQKSETRQLYGPEAMRARFIQKNVSVFAAINQVSQQLDAILRIYSSGKLHYLGDLVVHSEQRGRGLAVKLMDYALQTIPAGDSIVLIAGDDRLVDLYRKLGFALVREVQPVALAPGKILMSAALPRQAGISEFQQSFPIPEAPENPLLK